MLAERRMEDGGPPPPTHDVEGRRVGDCLRPPRVGTARETWPRDVAVLFRYVTERAARGAWDSGAPLNIVDLAPGDGERAWQILRLLVDCVPCLRVVAACATDEERRALARHPALRAARRAGRLRLVRRPREERAWRACLGLAGAPVVILAHGLCAALRQDLYACHYGDWMEGWIAAPGTAAATLDWRRARAASAWTERLAPAYLHGLNSAAVSLPTGALACFEPLLRACGGAYLLLASDPGVSQLAELRSGAVTVRADRLDEVLPVNFHALSLWLDSTGAQCAMLSDGQADDATWLLALREASCVEGVTGLPGLCDAWRQAEGEGDALLALAHRLAASERGDAADAAQAFAMWRASAYAPRFLIALGGCLLGAASEVRGRLLDAWRWALHESCARYFPPAEDDGFLRAAACLAAALGHWGTAAALLDTLAELYGDSDDTVRMRAQCLQRSGDTASAHALLSAAIATEPARGDEMAALACRLARWSTLPWYAGDIARKDALCLEPLGQEHAEAYLDQYRDPQIGMMTRLPEFSGLEALRTWIAELHAEEGRANFALMHAEYGFVGALSAHRLGESAFCHFWIGADFQGRGFILPAIRLLCAQLVRSGVRRAFTTAYPDNFRSLHVLRRAGFVALDERALPPEDHTPFFGLALESTDAGSPARLGAALRDYCSRSGGAFAFAGGAVETGHLTSSTPAGAFQARREE